MNWKHYAMVAIVLAVVFVLGAKNPGLVSKFTMGKVTA
jgi:hypothetical protein